MSTVQNVLTERRVVQAPMAGGVSTPELVAAVSNAGGLGFLAAGYQEAGALAEQIEAVRRATTEPFGVNLFVPAADTVDTRAVDRYRAELAGESRRYGTPLGDPVDDDDDWAAKLDLLEQAAVPVVSFAFGCPPAGVHARLRAAGAHTVVTVTSAAEAGTAAEAGADALCVQGIEAGGHRGSFTLRPEDASDVGLLALLFLVADAVDLPLIAAGGIMTARGVAAVLAAGASAAQLGTAFLATPESGAHPLHKAALRDPRFTRTSLTSAFTGRPARGLYNRFMAEHPDAPPGYPHIHHVTRPLRRAAAERGDADGMALWAGQGHRLARSVPAGALVRELRAA